MIERTYYFRTIPQRRSTCPFQKPFIMLEKTPGKIFLWNNRYFTTNFYYETVIVIADEVVDVNKDNKTYASEETLGDVIARF